MFPKVFLFVCCNLMPSSVKKFLRPLDATENIEKMFENAVLLL